MELGFEKLLITYLAEGFSWIMHLREKIPESRKASRVLCAANLKSKQSII